MSTNSPRRFLPHGIVRLRWVASGLALGLLLVAAGCTSHPAARVPSPLTSLGASTAASATATQPETQTTSSESTVSVRAGEPWIVHQKYRQGGVRLWLVRPDGSGDHELLPAVAGEATHPDWSPDGTRIAYVDDNDLWVTTANGTGGKRVFDCARPCVFADYPAWSPDGRSIMFVEADEVDGEVPASTVQTVSVATGQITRLFQTYGPEYASYPRWSPDASSVVLGLQRFATTRVDDCRPVSSRIAVADLTVDHPVPDPITDPALFADQSRLVTGRQNARVHHARPRVSRRPLPR